MARIKNQANNEKTSPLSLHKYKLNIDKANIAKISISKLARIIDPQEKLRKAVLINNTLKNLYKQSEDYIVVVKEASKTLKESSVVPRPEYKPDVIKDYKIPSHLKESVVNEDAETLTYDTLSLCDDIINEFLGKIIPQLILP